MKNNLLTIALAVITLAAGVSMRLTNPAAADEKADAVAEPRSTIAKELKPFNSLIGNWRGVGQPKRGSRKGAWTEKASCAWDFTTSAPAVVIKSDGGKQFQDLILKWDVATNQLLLKQKMEDTVRKYSGTMSEEWPEKIIVQSKTDDSDTTFRCTIQQLSDIRATILFEQRTSPTGSFRRIAEVGYTRSGTRLAIAGGNQRKCVVTGGLGTIPVTYKDRTYYVCCSGCLQAFNADPATIIADYQESLKQSSSK